MESNLAGQKRTDCLGIPLILRRVLRHLSIPDLLQSSLVNKQWNYEARCVLRDERRLTAMTTSYPFCALLRSFASDLGQMRVIPFSGLSIEMVPHCAEYLISELDPVYDVFLQRLALKQLTVRSYRAWNHHQECPAFVLFKKMLSKFGSVLEEFSLTLGSKDRQVFVEILQDCTSFSKLKTLKLKDEWGTREERSELIKMLVSRAPNLQLVHSQGDVDLKEILVVGGSSVTHVSDFDYCYSIYEIPERVFGQVKLERVRLRRFRALSIHRINRVLPVLLQNSTVTLNSIEMDLTFLVPLMCYGIRLENVEKLKLLVRTTNLQRFHPRVSTLVKNFDFTGIFPRLRSIHSSDFSQPDALLQDDEMLEMIEQRNNVNLKEPMPHRAVNITSLNLVYSSALQEFTVRFFAEMSPDIENLSVVKLKGADVPYNVLWQNLWVKLKQLEIRTSGEGSGRRNNLNLDSVFCGIFPQEVAELEQWDKEFLQRVNIVPVMPSMSCLHGLRHLKLFYDRSFRASTHHSRLLLSKVTGLIVFQRSPDLCVTLGTDDTVLLGAMRRMRPYASIARGTPYNYHQNQHH